MIKLERCFSAEGKAVHDYDARNIADDIAGTFHANVTGHREPVEHQAGAAHVRLQMPDGRRFNVTVEESPSAETERESARIHPYDINPLIGITHPKDTLNNVATVLEFFAHQLTTKDGTMKEFDYAMHLLMLTATFALRFDEEHDRRDHFHDELAFVVNDKQAGPKLVGGES